MVRNATQKKRTRPEHVQIIQEACMNTFVKKALAIGLCALAFAGSAFGQSNKRMTITVATYQIQPTDENGEMLKFYADKFGVDIKVMNIDHSKFHDLVNLRIAAGEIPDFFYIRDPALLPVYAKQGVLAKLSTEMLKTNAPDILDVIQKNAPGYMEMGKVNGVQYGIPIVNPGNTFHLPIVYRADWMKKVGVTKTPETLAEFETLMYKFANEDPDGNGKKDTYGLSKEGTLAVFGAFGIVPFDTRGGVFFNMEDGKVINSAVSKDARKGLELLAKDHVKYFV